MSWNRTSVCGMKIPFCPEWTRLGLLSILRFTQELYLCSLSVYKQSWGLGLECACSCLQRLYQDVRSSGARVTDSCHPPSMSVRTSTNHLEEEEGKWSCPWSVSLALCVNYFTVSQLGQFWFPKKKIDKVHRHLYFYNYLGENCWHLVWREADMMLNSMENGTHSLSGVLQYLGWLLLFYLLNILFLYLLANPTIFFWNSVICFKHSTILPSTFLELVNLLIPKDPCISYLLIFLVSLYEYIIRWFLWAQFSYIP